jgi:hypothetical protein
MVGLGSLFAHQDLDLGSDASQGVCRLRQFWPCPPWSD